MNSSTPQSGLSEYLFHQRTDTSVILNQLKLIYVTKLASVTSISIKSSDVCLCFPTTPTQNYHACSFQYPKFNLVQDKINHYVTINDF